MQYTVHAVVGPLALAALGAAPALSVLAPSPLVGGVGGRLRATGRRLRDASCCQPHRHVKRSTNNLPTRACDWAVSRGSTGSQYAVSDWRAAATPSYTRSVFKAVEAPTGPVTASHTRAFTRPTLPWPVHSTGEKSTLACGNTSLPAVFRQMRHLPLRIPHVQPRAPAFTNRVSTWSCPFRDVTGQLVRHYVKRHAVVTLQRCGTHVQYVVVGWSSWQPRRH